MYVMQINKKPVGECYILPPEEGANGLQETFLVAQYYNGTNVKLLKFKQPSQTVEYGSILYRIKKLEDYQLETFNILKKLVTLAGDVDTTNTITDYIDELSDFISKRDNFVKNSSDFVIDSIEIGS